MNEKVMVRIDGEVIAAKPGQSVLQVARDNGKYIPALCYMEGLSAQGSCRLCMIEIQGVKKLQPACTTPVAEGLSVTTRTAQLSGYRKMALELLVADSELAERRKGWAPPHHEGSERGYLKLYLDQVNQAEDGCDFDFLTKRPVVASVPSGSRTR